MVFFRAGGVISCSGNSFNSVNSKPDRIIIRPECWKNHDFMSAARSNFYSAMSNYSTHPTDDIQHCSVRFDEYFRHGNGENGQMAAQRRPTEGLRPESYRRRPRGVQHSLTHLLELVAFIRLRFLGRLTKNAPRQILSWDLHLPVTGRCRSNLRFDPWQNNHPAKSKHPPGLHHTKKGSQQSPSTIHNCL